MHNITGGKIGGELCFFSLWEYIVLLFLHKEAVNENNT